MASPRLPHPPQSARQSPDPVRLGLLRAGHRRARRVALAGVGAVIVDEFGRLLRRRAHERHKHEPCSRRRRRRGRHGRRRGPRLRRAAAPRPSSSTCSRASSAPSPWSASRPGDPRRLGPVQQRQRRRPPHPPLRARHPARLRLRHRGAADRRRGARAEAGGPVGAGIGLTFDEAALLLDLATSTGPARACSASSSASAPPRSSASRSSPCGCCAAASNSRRKRV